MASTHTRRIDEDLGAQRRKNTRLVSTFVGRRRGSDAAGEAVDGDYAVHRARRAADLGPLLLPDEGRGDLRLDGRAVDDLLQISRR